MKLTRRHLLIGGTLLCNGFPAFGPSALAADEPRTARTIFKNSFGHRTATTAAFQYTFGASDLTALVERNSASVIVHHGTVPATADYVAIHRHVEGLPLFLSKSIGVERISLADLKSLIEGKVANWRGFGGNEVPVNIAVRQDGVFGKSILHMLGREGISVPSTRAGVSSYEELAEFGVVHPGTILFGLRGTASHSGDLIELALDHKTVSGSQGDYPLVSEITVLVRKNDSRAIELGNEFAESLKAQAVADRMETQATPMIEGLERSLKAMATR